MSTTARAPRFVDLTAELKQDDRGLVYFPFQGQAGRAEPHAILDSFHLVSILPGQVRGNHQHPHKREWLYLFHGEGNLVWRDERGALQQRRLTGDQTLVIIPPGVPHALRNEGDRVLYLLAWRAPETPGVAEPDTVPSQIL